MPIETSNQLTPEALHPSLADLLTSESGQDLIEYALLAALLGLTATTAIKGVGTKISGAFTSVSSSLTSNV